MNKMHITNHSWIYFAFFIKKEIITCLVIISSCRLFGKWRLPFLVDAWENLVCFLKLIPVAGGSGILSPVDELLVGSSDGLGLHGVVELLWNDDGKRGLALLGNLDNLTRRLVLDLDTFQVLLNSCSFRYGDEGCHRVEVCTANLCVDEAVALAVRFFCFENLMYFHVVVLPTRSTMDYYVVVTTAGHQ